jgi:hypothetical protein
LSPIEKYFYESSLAWLKIWAKLFNFFLIGTLLIFGSCTGSVFGTGASDFSDSTWSVDSWYASMKDFLIWLISGLVTCARQRIFGDEGEENELG